MAIFEAAQFEGYLIDAMPYTGVQSLEGGNMTTNPTYSLTLHKTYYDKGFFNLGVDVDRFIRPDNGPITIELGESGLKLVGSVNRNANLNGTPRIMGGIELRNWIQRKFQLMECIQVEVIAQDYLRLKAQE